MSSLKTYTAADIARYHRGEMTDAEMHALEKAALDDPMLADALEGYPLTTTATADLQSLQNKLQQRIGEKQQKTFFFINPQWMKIAALFVLIVGGTWLVFRAFSPGITDTVSSGAAALERTPSADSNSISTVQNSPPALFTDSLQQRDEVIASGTKRNPSVLPTTGATSAASQAVIPDAATEEKRNTMVPEAATNDKAAASEITLLRSPVPASTSRAPSDTIRQLDVAQQQSVESVNEVAANRRMQTARAKAAIVETAEPEGGWQAFEKYITEKRKPVDAAKQKNAIAGDVELRFEVNKNGRPENIVVTRSFCQTCDEEAIRLLKEGPRWTGTNGKVKIHLIP